MKNPLEKPLAKIKSVHWKFWKRTTQKSSKPKKRKRRLHLGEIFILLVVAYFAISFWPLRELVINGFLGGRTLIVFTNEAEARPCGGFVTAVGEVQLFPPVVRF